jgi:calcium/proton exchanger cax
MSAVYVCYLIFHLRTHVWLYAREDEDEEGKKEEQPHMTLLWALVLLFTVFALMAVTGVFLVDSVDNLTSHGGIGKEFVSVILLRLITLVSNISEYLEVVKGRLRKIEASRPDS